MIRIKYQYNSILLERCMENKMRPLNKPSSHEKESASALSASSILKNNVAGTARALRRVFTQDAMLNISLSALLTTLSVSLLKTPIDSFTFAMLGSRKTNFGTRGLFTFSVLRASYTGFFSGVGYQLPKSAWTISAKASTAAMDNQPTPVINSRSDRKSNSFLASFFTIASMSLVEAIGTQHLEFLTDKPKISTIADLKIKWLTPYNFVSIGKAGLLYRYITSLNNFMSICMLSDLYVRGLNKLFPDAEQNHPLIMHGLAGVASGSTAAMLNFPLTTIRDAIISSGEIDNKNYISFKSGRFIIKEWLQKRKTMVPMDFFRDVLRPMILARMIKQGGTFGIILLCNKVLGDEPYNDFNKKITETMKSMSSIFRLFKKNEEKSISNKSDVRSNDNKPN